MCMYATLAHGKVCFCTIFCSWTPPLLLVACCCSALSVACSWEEAAPFYPSPPLEEAMLSKHQRAYEPSETSAAKRLRLNLSDLFHSNTVTGKRTQELLTMLLQAASMIVHLWENQMLLTLPGIFACQWWSTISGLNVMMWKSGLRTPATTKHSRQSWKWCYHPRCWLPYTGVVILSCCMTARKWIPRHWSTWEMWSWSQGDVVCRGVAGDGAPCNWDRIESIELCPWNIIGLAGQNQHTRHVHACTYCIQYIW